MKKSRILRNLTAAKAPFGDLTECASMTGEIFVVVLYAAMFGYIRSIWMRYGLSPDFAMRILIAVFSTAPFAWADDAWSRITTKLAKTCPRYNIRNRDLVQWCEDCLPAPCGAIIDCVFTVVAIAWLILAIFILKWTDFAFLYTYIVCFGIGLCAAIALCAQAACRYLRTQRALRYLR